MESGGGDVGVDFGAGEFGDGLGAVALGPGDDFGE